MWVWGQKNRKQLKKEKVGKINDVKEKEIGE